MRSSFLWYYILADGLGSEYASGPFPAILLVIVFAFIKMFKHKDLESLVLLGWNMVETWNYSFMVENMYVKSMTYYEDTPIQRHPLD